MGTEEVDLAERVVAEEDIGTRDQERVVVFFSQGGYGEQVGQYPLVSGAVDEGVQAILQLGGTAS